MGGIETINNAVINCNCGFTVCAKRIPKTKQIVIRTKGNCTTFTSWRLKILNGVYKKHPTIAKQCQVRRLKDKGIEIFIAKTNYRMFSTINFAVF